jgi:hypothetical protein
MDHIDRAGGRFVTVLPRNRLEDAEFRQWIQTNTPDWTCVWDRPNPRHSDGPRDCWYVIAHELFVEVFGAGEHAARDDIALNASKPVLNLIHVHSMSKRRLVILR